jgi:hypothetical protein
MSEENLRIKKETLEEIIFERLKAFEANITLSVKGIDIIWGESLDGVEEITGINIVMGE